MSDLVFTFHPRIITVSDIMPSSSNFSRERQSSLCIGSLGSRGLQRVCIANNIAATPRSLFRSKSGTTAIPSSMKSSILPDGSNGISTSKSSAWVYGMSSGKYDGGGNFEACGEYREVWSQSLLCNRSFARSVQISPKTHHSLEQGEPPKVSLRLNKPNWSHIIEHWAAVLPFNVIRLYADLISDFPHRILVFGR